MSAVSSAPTLQPRNRMKLGEQIMIPLSIVKPNGPRPRIRRTSHGFHLTS
jgi:hypothetical protein